MNKEILEKLYEELPVEIKPGGQGFKYIKTKDVIDRLNRTFEGNWSTEIIKAEKIGEECLVEVKVSVMNDDGHQIVHHSGFGSAKFFNNTEIGNIFKSAKSRAIKDAAKSFGVGLMLNTSRGGNDYSPSADSNPTDTVAGPNPSLNTPPTGGTPPAQGGFVNTTPPSGFQGTETAPVSDAPTGMPPATPFADTETSQNTGGFPPTQTEPVVSEPTSPPAPPTQNQGLPSMAPPPVQNASGEAAAPAQNTSNAAPPLQAPVMNDNMANAKITSIQKIVLDQRMKTEGKTFKEFAIAQFAALNHVVDYPFENVDDLLYKDALLIVAN